MVDDLFSFVFVVLRMAAGRDWSDFCCEGAEVAALWPSVK